MAHLVLIVEDDPAIRHVLELTLAAEGYATKAAGDGQEALAYLEAHSPGVILLDLRMPHMDGREFLRAWRQIAEHPQIPIILLTANYSEARPPEEIAAGLGVDDWLCKPFSVDELLEKVKRAIIASPPAAHLSGSNASDGEAQYAS